MKRNPPQGPHRFRQILRARFIEWTGPHPMIFTATVSLVLLLTFLAYCGSIQDGFINRGDPANILAPNPEGLPPLLWFTFALDKVFGGADPRIFHLHSILLHCLDCLLVFLLSYRLLGLGGFGGPKDTDRHGDRVLGGAFATSLLFGLHPLHVESVAWASRLGDLLCVFFYIMGVLFYLETPLKQPWKNWPMWASFTCFLLALFSGPIAVSFPLALFLLDAWPLSRLRTLPFKTATQKIPFLVLSLAAIILNLLNHVIQSSPGTGLPLGLQAMNFFHNLASGLIKVIVPTGLHPFYPLPAHPEAVSTLNILSLVFIFAVTLIVFYWRQTRPWLWAAWLFFTGTFLFQQILEGEADQAAPDYLAYLPILGPLLLLGPLCALLLPLHKPAFRYLMAFLVIVLASMTFQQCGVWRNPTALWVDVIRAFPGNSYIPYRYLGKAYVDAGKYEQALQAFDKAAQLAPNFPPCHNDQGIALGFLGRLGDAEKEFQTAALMDPHYAEPHFNLSVAYEKEGKRPQEAAELEKTVAVDPKYLEAWRGLGIVYGELKDEAKAIKAYETALSLDPTNLRCMASLASLFLNSNQPDKAEALYSRCFDLDRRNPSICLGLGKTYLEENKKEQALEAFRMAAFLSPPDPSFYREVGDLFDKAGEPKDAQSCRDRAHQVEVRQKGIPFPGGDKYTRADPTAAASF